MNGKYIFNGIEAHALIAFGDAETEDAVAIVMQPHDDDDLVGFEEQFAAALFTHLMENPDFMREAWEKYIQFRDEVSA